MREIINTGKCVSCGTCISVCPADTVKLVDGIPKLTGLCLLCGMCYNNCPQIESNIEKVEKHIFGRTRTEDEELTGIYTAAYAARSLQENIKGQDGGVVTAILINFFKESGDAVVVAGLDKENVWVPKPKVALNEEEILEAAGTKYTPAHNIIGVGDAVKDYDKKNIAVVGTPCQIKALQLMDQGTYRHANISEAVKLKIGLFCMETFAYDSFMGYLESVNVDAEKVTKFEIRDGKFIANYENEVAYETRLKNVKKLIRPCCHQCEDFSAEFADISVGNVGSPKGWSTILVRTKRGEESLKNAEKAGLIEVKPLEDFKPGMSLVTKLSRRKKRGAQKAKAREKE
jgi:coenzyme F420 hydrogenase subunit beta